MSRDIKFRQPLFVGSRFSTWHYWGHIKGGFISPCAADLKIESEQYTGLKDKNGKEIYEGDIVETIYTDHKKHKGVIYSQPTRLNWSVKHSSFANQDLFVYSRPDCSIEIIGNIYENPELCHAS